MVNVLQWLNDKYRTHHNVCWFVPCSSSCNKKVMVALFWMNLHLL